MFILFPRAHLMQVISERVVFNTLYIYVLIINVPFYIMIFVIFSRSIPDLIGAVLFRPLCYLALSIPGHYIVYLL